MAWWPVGLSGPGLRDPSGPAKTLFARVWRPRREPGKPTVACMREPGELTAALGFEALTTGRRQKRPRQLEEDLDAKFSTMGECNPVTYLEGCRLPIAPSGIRINLVAPKFPRDLQFTLKWMSSMLHFTSYDSCAEFSFGVVLLELIAGPKTVGKFGDGVDIVRRVKKTISELAQWVPTCKHHKPVQDCHHLHRLEAYDEGSRAHDHQSSFARCDIASCHALAF
ncbi:hypothetical protein RHSIM_Rhsim01G0163200 [Rhododendron simsii]|uniref:Serine-threonine/tyrosine-protein kinase catalytic domain-containing protein n=1 Tax=Rhododendron simsii TaxID=118357 RepID=A0A834HIG3_RHOSS|nr:hypothetical protein RHSIM_Rhsim01G0163200 [Rhododendron simsii]